MAQILQLAKLVELNGVTKVKIGTRRIEALLDVERCAARELRTKLALDKELVGTAPEDLQLVFDVDGHPKGRPCCSFLTFAAGQGLPNHVQSLLQSPRAVGPWRS